MLSSSLNALVSKSLLSLTYILLSQASANKAPKVMRLDVGELAGFGVTLHHFPCTSRCDRGGARLPTTSATKASEDVLTLNTCCTASSEPLADQVVSLCAERCFSRLTLILAHYLERITKFAGIVGAILYLCGLEAHNLADTAARAGQGCEQGSVHLAWQGVGVRGGADEPHLLGADQGASMALLALSQSLHLDAGHLLKLCSQLAGAIALSSSLLHDALYCAQHPIDRVGAEGAALCKCGSPLGKGGSLASRLAGGGCPLAVSLKISLVHLDRAGAALASQDAAIKAKSAGQGGAAGAGGGDLSAAHGALAFLVSQRIQSFNRAIIAHYDVTCKL